MNSHSLIMYMYALTYTRIGSDQCDSCGANCVRAIKAWHLEHGLPIDHGIQSVAVMQLSPGLKGMISQFIQHDPRQKLLPSKVRLCCVVCVHTVPRQTHTNTSDTYRFQICRLGVDTVYTKYICIRMVGTQVHLYNTGSTT